MGELQTIGLDSQVRKKVLRMIPHGIYVITSRHEDQVGASTIDWVTQASCNPPLLVTCLRKDSFICGLVQKSRKYALHFLGEGQKDFAARFLRYKRSSQTEINGQTYQPGQTGVPVLDEAPACVELEMVEVLNQFDHSVIFGQVVAVHLKREARVLLLRDTGWHYGA